MLPHFLKTVHTGNESESAPIVPVDVDLCEIVDMHDYPAGIRRNGMGVFHMDTSHLGSYRIFTLYERLMMFVV